MLDPAHIDFVQRLLVILGAAGAVWFLIVFATFYVQARSEAKIRAQIREHRAWRRRR